MNPVADFPVALQVLVLALGVARLTVVVTADRVARRPRWWLFAHPGFWSLLVSCPWCVSCWVGAATAGAWLLWPVGTTTALLPFAIAMPAGWASAWVPADPGPDLPLPPHP